MMISTRGRYALRVMIDLAENGENSLIAMKEVAERQGLSLKYLERILPLLVAEGLIEGTHGRGGGYRLTRDPADYNVGEILDITENGLAPVACLECNAEKCEREAECRTIGMWRELNTRIHDYLNGVKLSDLMKKES